MLCDEDHPPVYTYYTIDAEEARTLTDINERQDMNEDGTFMKKMPSDERKDHVFINNFLNKKVKVKTFSMGTNKSMEDI